MKALLLLFLASKAYAIGGVEAFQLTVTTANVNAGQIINGPLASSVLPSTVSYTTKNEAISGIKTFSSSVTITDTANGLSVPNSSVTASAFFGDGSHLSGISAGETNTFTSSKTFTSDVLALSSLTLTGIVVPSGQGAVNRSSQTAYTNVSTTQRTFLVAFATATLTTTGGPVAVLNNCSFSCQGTNTASINYIRDGKFVYGNASTGIESYTQGVVGNTYNSMDFWILDGTVPSAGVHSYAIMGLCDGGTLISIGTCQFGALEFK